MAADYLIQQGYQIAEKNYRTQYGEIDIIATKDSVLVFCEIKFRSTSLYGDPFEAVDFRKQRKISRTALYYYASHGYPEEVPCRFDVIGIYKDGGIRHMENAFDYQ